jgi:ABC-2 type transport system permease protein
MSEWWRGTRLVLERALVENLRSRTFRIVTALLLLVSVAAVTLPRLFEGGPTTYTLATVGPAPAALVRVVDAAGAAGGFETTYTELSDAAAVRSSVEHGDATVGLADDTLYVASRGAGSFPAVVSQAVVAVDTGQRLADLGLSADQVAQLQSIRPPGQVVVGVGAGEASGRTIVGIAVGIILYLALLISGTAIATTVATEKSTRISEVLLAVLRPSQVLVGTVAAVGIATLLQLVVLAVPLLIGVRSDALPALAGVTASDFALGFIWFVMGFMLFAFLYAAAGALVDKVTEVNSAIWPINALLVAGYLVGVIVVTPDPEGPWSVVASLFPLTAPLTMPIRWGAGAAPLIQVVLAALITVATAVALVAVSSRAYQRALLVIGRRAHIREVIGRPRS